MLLSVFFLLYFWYHFVFLHLAISVLLFLYLYLLHTPLPFATFSLFLNLLHLLMLSFSLLYRPPAVFCPHLVLRIVMLLLISSSLFPFIITPTSVFFTFILPFHFFFLPYVDYFSRLSSGYSSKILPSTFLFLLTFFLFFHCLLSSPPTT